MSERQSPARIPLTATLLLETKKNAHSTELQFVITVLNEKVEKVLTDVGDLVQRIGLQAGGKILGIRRLGKIAKQHNVYNTSQKRCRLILNKISSYNFVENYFDQSHYLQSYRHPVYIRKFLFSADRQLEKIIWSKHYHMVTVEGKDRQDLQIRN